jgi:NAD(P)-dependent dehydrogenase (short-subunit alcohol dehydrogenase family)
MSDSTDNPFDNILHGVYKATESNLKLQQQMLVGWTRYWPGFPSRGFSPCETVSEFREHVRNRIMDVAQAQRELLSEQFDAAINSFDVITGITTVADSSPPADEQQPAPQKPEEAPPAAPVQGEEPSLPLGAGRNIYQKVAVVTGAASGIGEAVAQELAKRGARAVMLVDRSDAVRDLAASINDSLGHTVAVAKIGDTTDQAFRKRVFNEAAEAYGPVTICVPAAGITRDALAVRVDKETGRAEIYPIETFRQVTEVNLLAPIYWGMEMVARIAEDRRQRGLGRWEPEERIQGVVVFLGSVSSQGNKGQISYAVAKAGLEGAAATLQKEAIFHGVRCGIIHPGFTDTPMARALGDEFLNKNILPYTQLRRLIRPDEIADAICFMISNSAVSGELWADAGWHPPA